jgi:hypothetical protein
VLGGGVKALPETKQAFGAEKSRGGKEETDRAYERECQCAILFSTAFFRAQKMPPVEDIFRGMLIKF